MFKLLCIMFKLQVPTALSQERKRPQTSNEEDLVEGDNYMYEEKLLLLQAELAK